MNIVEVLSRVANRYHKARYAGISAQGQQEALDAVNGAMMELYRLMPDHYKTKDMPLFVEAPVAVTLAVTSGTNEVAAASFTLDQVGRSVVASGDDMIHRVGGTDYLRDGWVGSTGSVSATVYHDYIYGTDFPFNRLLGDPFLISGGVEIPLTKINPQLAGFEYLKGVGRPRYYWLEDGGVSQGGDVVVAIRVLPMPDIAYRIRVRASYWPRRVLFADVASNADLPVPDSVFDSFIKLVGGHILGIPGWDALTADVLMAQSSMGAAQIKAMPQFAGMQHNRVGTPRGY